jgi:putative Mg2+ transporter-C (MgtC) family protein
VQEFIELGARLATATLIGATIGLNRDLHHKPTGLRTMALVALGAALIVQAAPSGTVGAVDFNATSRIIQGVITGVGFLGAGVIMRRPTGEKVHGLTTATSIWLTAGFGVLSGLGAWWVLLVALILAWIILLFGGGVERWFHNRFSNTPSNDH